MDDLDLVPVALFDHPVQLAAAIRAYRDDEGRAADFLAEMDRGRPVKFLRPVDRNAVADILELAYQHRHFGRIGAEMRMDVTHPLPREPRRDPARLGQINEMPEGRAIR